jgi:hypothetical protein
MSVILPLPDDDAATLAPLSEQVMEVPGASFDFQSIPQDYQDLRLVVSGRGVLATTFDTVLFAVNGDVDNASYRSQSLQSSNTTNTASQNLGVANARAQAFVTGGTSPAGDFGDLTIYAHKYSRDDRVKVLRIENEAMIARTTGGIVLRRAMLVRLNAEPIERITLSLAGGDWAAGSIASLYGVRSSFG